MLTQERRDIITRIVNEKNAVTVAELVEELDTSAATIRRDLTELDKERRIIKVFGGATSINSVSTGEDAVKEKLLKNVEAKDEISRYAASLIVDDDFVYVEAGFARADVGSPAAGTIKIQLSLAWDLTDILEYSLK